jgi:hypothetical protein
MNSPPIEAAAIRASADTGIEPITDLNKLTSPVNQGAWYDVEDDCYVFEDPLPLENDGLAPAVTQDNHSSPGLSQAASSQHEDARCTPQEPGPHGLPQPKRKDGDHEREENVSNLEKDILDVFREQEDLSPANAPKSPQSHRPSPEPVCLQGDQELDQSAPEVLRDSSPLCPRPQETAVIQVCSEEPQKKAVGEAREAEGDTSKPDRSEAAGQLTHEGAAPNTSSQTQPPECRASSQVMSSEEDEEDEEPRPAKRRKRNPQPTSQLPAHIGEQHTPQSSRSPSTTRESVTFADYQE